MNSLIEQNYAVFFPIFFVALWLTVTTLLALLSGWFELMAKYPNRTVEPILRVRFQSGAVGIVPMRDILTLDVCSSGFRVGMIRAFGPFCRAFFVPWESIVVIRKTTLFSTVAVLQFGNPVVGTLRISVRVADRLAGAAMGRWPEAGPVSDKNRSDILR